MKLFIYKFHNYFDGLIGLDLLESCKIDLKHNILFTDSASIPLLRYQCRKPSSSQVIPANSSSLVNIPIHYPDGDVFVPEQFLYNCIIQECVTTVTDRTGTIEMKNPTDKDILITFGRPVHIELYNIQCTHTENNSNRVNDVLARLRTNHLNAEERANLQSLCARYADVFYIESEPLTFTNKIKHHIRTHDELPVFTKSYRYPFLRYF